ncbi:MAG: hypothetical protein P8Z38_05555 [Robiginitalea sp.]
MKACQLLDKWNFWRKARNRHGVHSPFIYGFLEKSLYRKDLKALPPQRRLLMAAVDHFRCERAMASDPQSGMAEWLRSARTGLQWEHPPVDLFICDTPGKELYSFLNQPDQWKNDTVVFVGNLRKTKENYRHWRVAADHPAVRVVLETYPAGLLFFRVQQARQHFRIRI